MPSAMTTNGPSKSATTPFNDEDSVQSCGDFSRIIKYNNNTLNQTITNANC
jgi:hypothetical protein